MADEMPVSTPEQNYRRFWERYGAIAILCALAMLPILGFVIYEAVKLGVVDGVLLLQQLQHGH